MELEIGDSTTVTATVYPEDATDKAVTWISADENVATVENGVITAVAEGTTVVTASCGDVKATVDVTVNKKAVEPEPEVIPATSIVVDKETVELEIGDSTTVTATVYPEDATDKAVTWISADEDIATVEDGGITAVAEGTTVVTASCGDVKATVNVIVTADTEGSYPGTEYVPVTEIFDDVRDGEWYVPYVQYVYDEGLMKGNDVLFNPVKAVTRAQFITTLYRLAGEPEVTDYSACEELSDVSEGKYYTAAVCWAYSEGITTGNTYTKTFGVEDSLTRQQLVTFMFRYAEKTGCDIEVDGDYSFMLNADKVNSYAEEAMSWSVGMGLINGSKKTDSQGNIVYDLAPQKSATRAQLAKILSVFAEF